MGSSKPRTDLGDGGGCLLLMPRREGSRPTHPGGRRGVWWEGSCQGLPGLGLAGPDIARPRCFAAQTAS